MWVGIASYQLTASYLTVKSANLSKGVVCVEIVKYTKLSAPQSKTLMLFRRFPYVSSSSSTFWDHHNHKDRIYVSLSCICSPFTCCLSRSECQREHLLKNFAQHLTKVCNRLLEGKMKTATMIKYDIREKYPDNPIPSRT